MKKNKPTFRKFMENLMIVIKAFKDIAIMVKELLQ